MDMQFEIACRSIRIGSLKAFPPKGPKLLKLSLKGLRFHVSLGNTAELNDVKIRIPLSGIVLIEGYIGLGCPVIWIRTDDATAQRVRRQCLMMGKSFPHPNFDPQSKELADQRIAIIPNDDPIEKREVMKFYTLVRLIASERNIAIEKFFREMPQTVCNQQLVECTRYISNLKKLQTAMQVKQEHKSDVESLPIAIKPETDSSPVGRMLKQDNPIVIISSEDEDAEQESSGKNPVLTAVKIPENGEMPKLSEEQTDSSDQLPVFNLNVSQRKTLPPENNSSDLPDLEQDTSDAHLQKISDELDVKITNLKSEETDQTQSDKDIGQKRKAVNDFSDPQMIKRVRPGVRDESDKSDINPQEIPIVQSSSKARSPLNRAISCEKSATTSKQETGDKQLESDENKSTIAAGALPNSKIDVKSVRGTAALTSDMLTLHQDMESMLSATPLCICVVKSQYVINYSSHKIACMALDNIDGRLTGCVNPVTESHMMRPSMNLPAHGLCSEHKARMLAHECCPGCGTFCAGGTFLVCNHTKEHQHRFHRNCLILTRHTMDCPHCGCPMSDILEVTVDPSLEFLKKYDQCSVEVVEKSPEKRKEPSYPACVVRIPGVTTPVPEKLFLKDDVQLCPNNLKVLVETIEDELPKKLRFQEKSLIQLVKQGDLVKALQLLCGTAGNPDARDSKGSSLRTALHEAVISGNLAMVHALVMAGANVNAQDVDGKTPIFFAEELERIDILKYLITCKANLRHGDTEGMTPLHYAAKEGRLETCLALLKYGREVINSTDDGGWTPLVWAAEHQRTETALCLKYYDAGMHSVDEEGNICLQWAALAGNKDILLICLRKNSNVDHQNLLGDTALHIAARQDNRECVVILLAWGANPLIRNREGQTPADCAKDPSLCQVSLLMNAMTRSSITDHKGFEPLDRERLLSPDISRGKEKIAISCVNAVDEAPCPVSHRHEFLYISKNIYKYTSVNAIITNTKSCKCIHDCSSCECGQCWYDSSGRLLPSFDFKDPPSIYECNPFCKCPSTCRNRVIQKGGVRFRIQVFRTTNIGWGVRALEPILRGSFICEFVGEVIADGDAREDDFYLFDLDNTPGGPYCIDGRSYGNVSRYINHNCEPNLAPIRFFYEHQDKNFPRIAFFAMRHIAPGEQLCFDYGDGFWDEKRENFTCECGASSCRYSEKAFRKRRKILEVEMEEAEEEKESLGVQT